MYIRVISGYKMGKGSAKVGQWFKVEVICKEDGAPLPSNRRHARKFFGPGLYCRPSGWRALYSKKAMRDEPVFSMKSRISSGEASFLKNTGYSSGRWSSCERWVLISSES